MAANYSSLAPRGSVPQQQYSQPQQQYAQPQYEYAQQPQYPQQNYQQPQPVQQGFAPRGNNYFTPHQAMMGMEGSKEFMDAYQKNMAAFDEMNRKVKEGVSKSEAVENLKKMADFKTEVDGSMVAEHGAQNASQVVNTLKYTCLTLEHPEEWLPTWITGERRERLATELSEAMVKVVAVLNKYILKVQNISSGNSGQNKGQ